MTHTFGSLFAGVGGFDLGFENAGFECRFQVEWDKHCQQTLAHHWPDVPRWGDVSEVNGADLPPVDVITYGFPCQDLSIAGKRAGLDGGRSGLFFEAVRIIKEMREATNGRYPTWAVAENVAGLLNADRGHAMGRCIDELAEAGSLVIEWCLVDAQWFGVPQRRRRVFLASCFDPATAERCPDPLFPVGTSSSRDSEKGRKTGEDIAGTLACRTNTPSATDDDAIGAYIPTTFSTLNTNDGVKWGSNQWVDEGKAIIQETSQPVNQSTWWDDGQTADTLTVTSDRQRMPDKDRLQAVITEQPTAVVFTAQRVGEEPRVYTDIAPSLLSRMGTGGNNTPIVAQHDHIAQPIAVDTYNGDINTDTFHTLRTTTQNYQPHVVAPSLTASNNPSRSPQSTEVTQQIEAIHQAQPNLAVRRLTPIECERLMGWPDNHTLHRADGKTNADSTRYKMCGNGIVAPVSRWIAKHLANTLPDD